MESKTFKESKQLMDVSELSALMGRSISTIRKDCCYKRLPYQKIGKRVFFSRPRIEAWLQEQTREIEPISAAAAK